MHIEDVAERILLCSCVFKLWKPLLNLKAYLALIPMVGCYVTFLLVEVIVQILFNYEPQLLDK
jgi:hypothetical protein